MIQNICRTALWILAFVSASVLAQVCAPPALLLTAIPPGGIINDYYDGSASPTLSPGASTLVLGTRDTRGFTTSMVIGDLLMVMQMQDGTINPSNSSTYGDGSGSGNGSTSTGNAGLYEFVRVTAVTGSNITFTPKLTNNYSYVDSTASTAQKRYQVVRTLQFASVNTTVAVIAPSWNGKTGGAVAMDVRDTLTLTNQSIEGQTAAIFVAGKGFRGGLGQQLATTAGANSEQDYASVSTAGYHASKAEGFMGTPLNVATKTNGWGFVATNSPTNLATAAGTHEGYPGAGSFARGAPGNAGGGGTDGATPANANDKNAGGGGGGNYGPGGNGGRPWSRPLLDTGGRGGAGYAGTLAFNRIFLGGGGGAGSTNDGTADGASPPANGNLAMQCGLPTGQCSSGAAGGGVVVIRARTVAGSGTIDARGAHAYNVQNDAGGGGGAGGSVVIETPNGGQVTVNVTGGDGGNAWANSAGWSGARHGPGGAGGGGFIAYAPSSMAVTALVAGGAPGQTLNDSAANGGPTIEYYGSVGYNGGYNTFQSPNVPGVPQAAKCNPNLTLTKTDGVTALASPGTTTYTLTVTNNGVGDSAGTVTMADKLPPGLTVVAGPLTISGPQAARWSCNAANTTDITCTSLSAISGSGGTTSFAISAAVSAGNGTSIVNKALISGGGDPLKATTASPALAANCVANDNPIGCAVDTDTVLAPSLTLNKTNGVTQLTRGTSVTYTLTVSNVGGSGTVGTFTVADLLPTGLTYSGTTPFSVNNFTCAVSGQGITCDRLAALAASTSTSITFTVSVGVNAPSSVINLAKVGGGGDPSPLKSTRPTTATTGVGAGTCPGPVAPATTSSDPNTGCAADEDAVLYVSLNLTKDDGKVFVNANGTTDYQFTVTNIGTVASVGTLTVADVLPGTITFATSGTFTPAGTSGSNWSCTRNTVTSTFCTSTTPISAGGTSVFVLTANVGAATVGSQQLNRARVGGGGDVSVGMITSPTSSDVQTCSGNGNPAGCATDLNTVQSAALVRMSKSHPNPQSHGVGDSFTFTLVISNTGGAASGTNSVQMFDNIPPGLTISSVTAATPFTCSTAGQSVTCSNTISPLGTATTAVILIGVTVAPGATNTLLNAARVGTNGTDPQNNTFPTTTTTATCTGVDVPSYGCAADLVPLKADLQIVKSQRQGTSGVFVTSLLGVSNGDIVQFQINVTNAAGSAGLTTVTFSDLIPNAFSTVSIVTTTNSLSPATTGCTATLAGNQVNGSVSSMAAGSSCTVIVQAIAASNTAGITNTAIVNIPTGITDTNSANNTSSVTTAIGFALLTVTKTDGTTTVAAGSTTRYTLTVANLGPSPAPGVTLTDGVAAGLNCTAVTCSSTAPNMCPASPTIAALQGPGLMVSPAFPSGASATFIVTCGVTATGQ